MLLTQSKPARSALAAGTAMSAYGGRATPGVFTVSGRERRRDYISWIEDREQVKQKSPRSTHAIHCPIQSPACSCGATISANGRE
jgi:hypothetical protein